MTRIMKRALSLALMLTAISLSAEAEIVRFTVVDDLLDAWGGGMY